MIWNESRECISRDELIDLQGKRLVKLVKRMYYGTEYYRMKMQQKGLEPGDIRGLEDLEKLPFTTKEDLRNTDSFGMFVAPQSEIVRYHTLNAMTGMETIMGYTRNDLDIWSECVARMICMAGLYRNDTIQIAYQYGLSADGFGAHYGAEKVGAAVVPASICNTSKLVAMMRDLDVTGIMCTPSYLMHIAQSIEDEGLVRQLKLRTAICGAESWSETMRTKIQTKLGIKAYGMFGLSELAGLGAAGECECQRGMHIQEDYFIAEILDPLTLKEVPDGQRGELVFTTLDREGIPLLRYRTLDFASINHKKCDCGRTTARIEYFSERTDDMLIIRGNSVFPPQIESALLALEDINASYMVCVKREHNLDIVEVFIKPAEFSRSSFTEDEESIKRRVAKAVRNVIGMMPKVIMADEKISRHFDEEKVTIFDKRNYD